MNATPYAHALLKAAENKDAPSQEALVKFLLQALSRRGHESLLPHILREYIKLQGEVRGKRSVTIRVAQEKEKARAMEEAQRELGIAADMKEIVDENLVGGFVVESGEMLVDRSFRRALHGLYKRLIAV